MLNHENNSKISGDLSTVERTQSWKEPSIKGLVSMVLPQKPHQETVDHPDHYNNGKIECIDAIEAALGQDGFESWLVGTIIKYLWRYKHKNGVEDLKKAKWYMDRLVSAEESTEMKFSPGFKEYIEGEIDKIKYYPKVVPTFDGPSALREFKDYIKETMKKTPLSTSPEEEKKSEEKIIDADSTHELMDKIVKITKSQIDLLKTLGTTRESSEIEKRKEKDKADGSVKPK